MEAPNQTNTNQTNTSQTNTSRTIVRQTIDLTTDLERELASGAQHEYTIALQAGQFVQILVEQIDIDVAVDLFAPNSEPLLTVDTPVGRQGPEIAMTTASTSAEHRVVVRHAEHRAPGGKYRLTVPVLRDATRKDRARATAERLFSQAEELRRQGEKETLDQAPPLYFQALEIFDSLGDQRRQGDTLHRLGWAHGLMDERQAAREFFERSLEIYRQLSDPAGEALCLNEIGAIRWKIGETEEGLASIEQALAISRTLEDLRWQTADVLSNLGVVYRRLGRTEEALNAYQEAQKIWSDFQYPRKKARVQLNLANLLLRQGQLQEAADHLQSTLEVWTEDEDARLTAYALSRLGDVRKRQRRLDEALECFEEALRLHRKTGNRDGEATTLNSLGTVHLLRQDSSAAEQSYQQAQALSLEIEDREKQAVATLNLGRLASVTGAPQRALELNEQAAPLVAELADPQIIATYNYGQALALYHLGDYAATLEWLEPTLQHVEELRTGSASESLSMAFFASRQHYFDLYIDVLMHLAESAPEAGYLEKAFEVSEQRRARALLDLLGESAADIRQHADPELLEQERSVQKRLNRLERERVTKTRQPNDRAELAALEKAERQCRSDLDQVRAKLRNASPRYAALTQPQSHSLREIQSQLLDRHTLLLSFSLAEERSFLWRISQDGITGFVLPGRQEIEPSAVKALELLVSCRSEDEDARAWQLAQISEALLGSVASDLGRHRLVIVADGSLLHLPFSVLPKPGSSPPKLLIEDHEIVHLPSASVVLNQRRELHDRFPAPKQIAVFANPAFTRNPTFAAEKVEGQPLRDASVDLRRSAASVFADEIGSLPFTQDEAEEIFRLARGEVLKAVGFAASKKAVLEGGLHDYQILHFATHGLLNRAAPELSGLILSLFNEQGEPQDGFLRLHEIYNLHLPAELVVLSAGQTGLGREVRGEGLLNWTRAFMYAGAPRVLVSLWNVGDRSTAELMKRFYWCLFEGGATPARALRAAQIAMLEEEPWKHPKSWAGFILQGDWQLAGAVDGDYAFEGPHGGGGIDGADDLPYSGTDDSWCEGVAEPWARKLCCILQDLTS